MVDDHCMKGSKYGAFSGPYFPVFGQNIRKYGPEKTPYLDTFHAVDYLRYVFPNLNAPRENAPS